MSAIAPLQHSVPSALNPAARAERPAPSAVAAPSPRGSDQVALSNTARLFAQLGDTQGVRQDLGARVREEIAAGTYETPERLNAAIECLAQDLAS